MKKLTCLMAAILLLGACSHAPAYYRTPQAERTALSRIYLEDTYFNGSIMEKFYRDSYSIDDRWEDERLQTMVTSLKLDYPIDTLEEINRFSWELYDIAVAEEVMSSEMKPVSAERYADGIWHFTYSPMQGVTGYYDGDQVSFLISGADGHVITLRTEMLFLDPFGSSSWQMYNGSDDLAPGERPALKTIAWYEYGYNEQRFPTEERSVDDWFENQQWQSIAATIKTEYPLLEETQITAWAWSIYDAATAAELMEPSLIPSHAWHFNDGIWFLIFEGNPSNDGENPPRRSVLISDADGHVIHVK